MTADSSPALAAISLAASMIVEFSSANQRSFGLD
jgi:hypothetical protein